MPGKPHAPILKPVEINNDSGDANFGNPTNWSPDTTNAPAANRIYGIVVSSQDAGNNQRGHFSAERIWNSVWNDYADFQLLNDEYIPGKCYFDTTDGARICDTRCQLSVIGLASDTFAQVVGKREDQKQVPIAVAGWALAYVDQEYPCGTPLTNNEKGELTEMTLEEKRNYPERLVAIYKRKEMEELFGTESKIKVNGRHWVKVK